MRLISNWLLFGARSFDDARDFIHVIIVKLDGIGVWCWRDPKSYLQEISASYNQTPVYKVLSEEGPDHDKVLPLSFCWR